MFLNLSKVSGNYTPHGGGDTIFSQQFSPVTPGDNTMLGNSSINNIRSATTLQTIKQPNYKTKNSTNTSAATELANMIKSSFMLNSALKNQDINSTRNQNMQQPPHFLTSINHKTTASVLLTTGGGTFKNMDINSNATSSTLRLGSTNNENMKKQFLPPTVGNISNYQSRVSFGAPL